MFGIIKVAINSILRVFGGFMFGNSENIRKETKKEINNEPCYGGFSGRLSYELMRSKNRRVKIAEIIRKAVTVLVAFIFFGSLGALAGMMVFHVVQGDFIGYGTVKQSSFETGAKGEASLNLADSMEKLSFVSDGVEMVSVTKEYSERYRIPMGVLVKDISADSPGYVAGVRDGDIIVMVGGDAVLGKEELSKAAEAYKTGDSVPIRIFRDGEHYDFAVAIK